MTNLNQAEILPRLLDLEDSPPLGRRRWYWRYVHRWRRHLFQIWKRDSFQNIDDSTIEQAIDDILGVALLLEYFHRAGCRDLPTISSVVEGKTCSTAGIMGVLAKQIQNPILAAVLDPNDFSVDTPIPICIFSERFEKRLADATWFAFRDGELPLSFFGDFHQLCAGNPLATKSLDSNCLPTRQVRGMFYTPSPIVDYLVWITFRLYKIKNLQKRGTTFFRNPIQ